MAFETINLGTQPTGTGGDTARSAFEKVNKNFITSEVLASAMSQAQFDAIRAQNNEEYAASGFVNFGKHYNVAAHLNEINEGLWTAEDSPNQLRIGRGTDGLGLSKTNFAVSNIAGVIWDIVGIGTVESGTSIIKLPQAPDGKTTYNKSTGANVVYATTTAAFNAAAVDVNLEVVTDRVDMWGFESFLEEVSSTNPYIYPNGLIQSLATTMDGIATSASNRPVTYYAWFTGDTGSKGKGVNYFTLTDAQKRKVLANHKNKLYFLDDGRLVQWRVRGRSFAGTGNGDWGRINSVGGGLSYSKLMGFTYGNSASTLVLAQGAKNSVVSVGGYVGNEMYTTSNATDNPFNKKLGVFGLEGLSASVAINGECYFLVCGTVNRLNQGAYHPSFNPSGTRLSLIDGQYWYATTNKFTSTASTFTQSHPASGNIGNGSGRPDGRSYDAIYASGQGGVCRDMRYSANHTTLEKFAEADLNVKNGTYRGFEKLVITRIIQVAVTEVGSYIGGHYIVSNVGDFTSLADKQYSLFYNKTRNIIGYIPVVETANLYLSTNPICKGLPNIANSASGMTVDPYTGTQVGDEFYLIAGSLMTNSVGGSSLQTDVIGDPANILLTDALKNGWEGSWIPDLPAGGGKLHYGTRKNINLVGSQLLTSNNNGATWDSFITGTQVANITNALTGSYATNEIRICQYQAFAKQTNPTGNTKIYGGKSGLGVAYSNSRYATTKGTLLGESLIDKICTSDNQANIQSRSLALHSFSILENGLLSQDIFEDAEHSALDMSSPTNNSPAFKALNYNTETNMQAGINYAATELKWDGTDWGDDSRIHIVNNANTLIDLNGNAVRVVTHKLKEPIGWIKNTI